MSTTASPTRCRASISTFRTGSSPSSGRNGMGKTTLCNAVMGLVPIARGSIQFEGDELAGLSPSRIAHHGVGYVPQGRRLWASLTVDEHLRLCERGARGGWTRERIYDAFSRLADRRTSRGGQLSGGEQQMLAISRALLLNPRLLVMDEPTEGLAPVIVQQVEDMLIRIGEEGEISVLVIEQNIGVATAVSEDVAIMVNGRIHRIMDAAALAADRELQQRLLGVGRHGGEGLAPEDAGAPGAPNAPAVRLVSGHGAGRVWISNPVPPTRWTKPVPVASFEAAVAALAGAPRARGASGETLRPLSPEGEPVVLVVGTFDTKGAELKFLRDRIVDAGQRTKLIDCPPPAGLPPRTCHPTRSPPTTRRDRTRCSPAIAAPRCARWRLRSSAGCRASRVSRG